MKKILYILFTWTLLMSFVLTTLSSCWLFPCKHVDKDGDYICDKCGEVMPNDACKNHVDSDLNGFCDNCGEKMEGSTLKPTTDAPHNAVTEPVEHFVTNSLHKVNVTETNNPFVVDGKSDYTIVYSYSGQNQTAVSYIVRQISLCTGCLLNMVEYTSDIEYSADSKYIVFDVPELFETAGGKMPEDDIGETGYYITNIGNSVFVNTLTDNGATPAAISLLTHLLGFQQYSQDMIVYNKDGSTMPKMEIIERPDFDYYVQSNKINRNEAYGMGFSDGLFVNVAGETWHNTMNYVPQETYGNSHPDWYSTANNELCYTVRGNEKEYQALVNKMAELVLFYSDQYPDKPYITITIEDAHRACQCDACQASREKYGCDSGALVKFINAVNRIVQAELDARAEAGNPRSCELYILFFAYFNMEKAPVVKNADGTYSPVDEEVVCDPNVGPYIAPIYAAYNQSFYHQNNASAKETIDGWQACSQNLYMWLYETNYAYYLYPINTWDTMIETYRYCKSVGAKYMFPEGQYNQGAVTHFSRLKEFFNSEACFDVNRNYEDIVDDFFANYYGEGGVYMRKFFDELQAHLRYLEETYPAQINGNIYNNMENQEYWPQQLLERWLGYCDEAYAAIEKYKTEDPALYEVLYEHIKIETMFPRFALIRLHEGKYSDQVLYDMKVSFCNDARDLGITNQNEQGSIEVVFAAWGLL